MESLLERVRKAQQDSALSSPLRLKQDNKGDTTFDESLTHLGQLPGLSGVSLGKTSSRHRPALDIDDELERILNNVEGDDDRLLQDEEEENGGTSAMVFDKFTKGRHSSQITREVKSTSSGIVSTVTTATSNVSTTGMKGTVDQKKESKTTSDEVSDLLTSRLRSRESLPPLSSGKLTDIRSLPPLHSATLNTSLQSPLQGLSTTEQVNIKSFPKAYDTQLEDNVKDNIESSLIKKDPLKQQPVISTELKQKQEYNDYSLSQEVLSELSEVLEGMSDSESNEENDDTPIMNTDHLKALDNIKLVSSDDAGSGEEDHKDSQDFNRLAETDYNKLKANMERSFEQKRVKPDDPDFIYDKEVEFGGPVMESGWDSDSSASEF